MSGSTKRIGQFVLLCSPINEGPLRIGPHKLAEIFLIICNRAKF